MIVTGEHVARFVSRRLDFPLCPPYTTLGIERDGLLMGGVILNQFEGADVHLTAAGSLWTPAFMHAVGYYIFDQLGCARFTMKTEDEEVVKYAKRLGGEVEGILRDHFGQGRDAVIIGVLKNAYRFYRKAETEQG